MLHSKSNPDADDTHGKAHVQVPNILGLASGFKPQKEIEKIIDRDATVRAARRQTIVHVGGWMTTLETHEEEQEVVNGDGPVWNTKPIAVVKVGDAVRRFIRAKVDDWTRSDTRIEDAGHVDPSDISGEITGLEHERVVPGIDARRAATQRSITHTDKERVNFKIAGSRQRHDALDARPLDARQIRWRYLIGKR